MTSAYHKIPQESRELLESAVRMLQADRGGMTTDDLVLMVYNLGRIDGRMVQLDRDEAIAQDVVRAYESLRRRACG